MARKRDKSKAIFILAIPLLLVAEPEYRWPLRNETAPDLKGITSTFGESRGDHFHNGIDIASTDQSVRPVAAGQIVYSRSEADSITQGEQGPGNFILIRHRKNLLSGYFHLNRIAKRSGQVAAEETIGNSGNSGYSGGAHLHFFLYSEGNWLNPLSKLPAITDPSPPQIKNLVIITSTSRAEIRSDKPATIRLTRKYPVLLTIRDPGLEKNTNRGIYKLFWKLNQGKEESISFENIAFNGTDWQVSGKNFERAYQAGLYNLGELDFAQGLNTLSVRALDFQGNETRQSFELTVNKEY